MKNVLLVVLLGMMVLGACSYTQASEPERFTGNHDMDIIRDTETGCKYVIYDGYKRGGITPLLKSDGTPDCS